jgi:adenosine deaminase
MNVSESVVAFLRAMPKVDIHSHLLGTIRKATFLDLIEQRGFPISKAEVEDFYTRGDKPKGVLHILRALDQHILTDAESLHRLVYEFLQDMAAHNVRYCEFFWNPTGTANVSGVPYPTAVDAMIRAVHEAERDFRIIGRIIPSIDRQASVADAVEMVQWVIDNPRKEVLGIGIDYRENDFPPELFWKAYRNAKEADLKVTAHAGEFGMPWTNVETAVELLKVDRVDHGYTIVDNPALAKRYAEAGIVFTVVPTNSYYLRTLPPDRWAKDHPIRAMAALGLHIHPNTDDPTLHHVTPTQAWTMMMKDFDFSLDDVLTFTLNGLKGAWLPETLRQQWLSEWPVEFSRLRRDMGLTSDQTKK